MDVLHEKGLTPLRVILGFSLVSTTLHYAHNVIRAADYPQIPGIPVPVTQVVVAFGWVLFTAFGWLGYRAYERGSYPRALAFLLVYSLSGLASAGHFLVGVPRIPAFWFATIFTDSAAALALWVFVTWAWSVLNRVTSRDQVSTQH
jgi:predicted cation transporter